MVKGLKNGERANLSGADLYGVNLDDANLWKTKLSGAKNIK